LPGVAGRPIDLTLPLHLTERIREIAAIRVHYDYRRIHVLLRREGWRLRLYCEMGLQLRAKTSKRRGKAKRREDRQLATRRHVRLPRARDNELVHNLLDWLPKWTTMQGNVGAH